MHTAAKRVTLDIIARLLNNSQDQLHLSMTNRISHKTVTLLLDHPRLLRQHMNTTLFTITKRPAITQQEHSPCQAPQGSRLGLSSTFDGMPRPQNHNDPTVTPEAISFSLSTSNEPTTTVPPTAAETTSMITVPPVRQAPHLLPEFPPPNPLTVALPLSPFH